MNSSRQKKIVILGMMTLMPVPGAVWLTLRYLLGFRRLGHDVYYVEAHAVTPGRLMQNEDDNTSAKAAAFIANVMQRFDLDDKWAFHALHDDGRCYGMSEGKLKQLYDSADLIINLHGATVPLPEHSRTGRLIYLETDPVELEIELYNRDQTALQFLEPHVAFFTWGSNYGRPDCEVPLPERFHFHPTLPPVIMDLWSDAAATGGDAFTTIGNWRQAGRDVVFRETLLRWSKHFEFLKFIDLPKLTNQKFELALASHNADDEQLLKQHGWNVRPAAQLSSDLDVYHRYIHTSRGEFTVAKEQNVRLKSGWFSDRSAEYLAAGRPVITQETGFSNSLPTGNGLFGFSTMDEILAAVDRINSNYERHCRAAAEIARAHFSYDVVLPRLLEQVGL